MLTKTGLEKGLARALTALAKDDGAAVELEAEFITDARIETTERGLVITDRDGHQFLVSVTPADDEERAQVGDFIEVKHDETFGLVAAVMRLGWKDRILLQEHPDQSASTAKVYLLSPEDYTIQ